jgi:hypothetical protein
MIQLKKKKNFNVDPMDAVKREKLTICQDDKGL